MKQNNNFAWFLLPNFMLPSGKLRASNKQKLFDPYSQFHKSFATAPKVICYVLTNNNESKN